MQKVLIATPAFGGQVSAFYAIALAETYQLLLASGISTTLYLRQSGSLLMAERNAILMDFLKGDYTHLLCIDADIGWEPEAVLQLLSYEQDFVGACYVARGGQCFLFRPEIHEDGSLIETSQNLLQMRAIPAGFMLLSRRCVEEMCRKYQDMYYKPKDSPQGVGDGYALFNCEVVDGEFWGEDFIFCMRAKAAGFSILVDPRIELNHAGQVASMQSAIESEGTQIRTEEQNAT